MIQNQLLLSSIPLEDFKEVLRDCIKTELALSVKPASQEPDELITEEQARTLLQFSKVTLKKWRDEGKIPFYRYGSRIRYKRAELISTATVINSLKKRRA